MSSHIKSQLIEAFNTCDLYLIFNTSKDASGDEIKRAFRKLALIHHPDKGGSDIKFKAICVVHSILSDVVKRAEYDQSGLDDEENFDENGSGEESFEHWYTFYRNIFPIVTIDSINTFREKYIGSEEERNDILNAYISCDGNIEKMKQLIFFIEDNDEDEQRLIHVIDNAIKSNDIKLLSKYEKFKSNRIGKEKKNQKKKKRKTVIDDHSMEDLASFIISRGRKSEGKQAMNALIAKYSNGSSSSSSSSASRNKSKKHPRYEEEDEKFQEIPDDEFEKLQHEIMNRKNLTSSSSRKVK